MPLSTNRRLGPEDQALAQKRTELAALRATLAERELDLEDLRAEIAGFRGTYLRQVGAPFAELAEWRARILELKALLDPSEEATAKAKEARERARQTHEDAHSKEAETPVFNPDSALKSLYREVARRIHPDFCKNAEALERRTRFMAEANRAYEANDPEGLQRILDEYHEGAEVGNTEAAEAEFSRLKRQIARAKTAIAGAEREREMLGMTQMGRLKQDCEAAEHEGRDLLAEMAGRVHTQTKSAQVEFQVLSRDASLRERFKMKTG